jgi:S1-C subfamily serine protease
MSYSLAQESGTPDYTYGWKIITITRGGPSDGKLIIDDIIIAMDNQTIRNNDDLASYLEEHTQPGDTLSLTVIRNNTPVSIELTLGTRPAASA